jgi:uncharacterized protein (TIGR02145 family)
MHMKKLILLFFLFSAVISNAQRTMFGGHNNYVASTIFSPTLSGTSAISTISRYGASSGGTITSNGGATITASGVCWSSTSNTPTIVDTKTTDGLTAGTFTSTITGLTAGVTYHVRAYATNSVGTGYGPVQTFTSTATAVIPTIGSSLGGGVVAYVYQNGDPGYTSTNIPVLIAGNDVLGFTRWHNGSGISTGATSAALGSGFANTNTIITSQGASTGGYTYAAALARNYTSGGFTDWYLPSQNELNQLYLNRVAIGGFTNAYNYFWASTEVDASNAKLQNFLSGGAVLDFSKSATGGTVRAVRTITISPSTTPVLAATTPASSVGTTSAVVGGNVTDEGMTQVTARGFVYGTSSGASTFTVNAGAGQGSFSSTLTGLTGGTTYYVRSFATNAQGTTYGTEVSFTPVTVITTVTIGTQIWTNTNLDVTTYRNGDPITYASNAVEWNAATNAGIGAWSYYNWDPANGAIYGKLYNWYAVNDSRRLAPSGYHIPTKLEFNTLATNSGTTLKSSSAEWGVNSGTNTTGFTGLPGGNNNISQFDRFEDKGTSGWFWTSDEDGASPTKAYFRLLHQTAGFVDVGSYLKKYGMSIRLVRD